MKNRVKFLTIYGVIVVGILAYIVFFAPDTMFYDEDKVEELTKQMEENKEIKKYKTIEEQKENLLNATSYDYSFRLMYGNNIEYNCNGSYKDGVDSGNCVGSKVVSYNSRANKKEVLNNVDTHYLEADEILALIKEEVEPTYLEQRKYEYSVMIGKHQTDITISTDKDNITDILVSNDAMTYLIKYTNISN
jgi:hypothetical protein